MSSNQNDFEFRLRALIAKEGLDFQRLNRSREFRRMSTASSSDENVASDRLTRQSISMSPRKPIFSASVPKARFTVGSVSELRQRALSPRKSVSTTRARSSVPSLPSNTKRAASPKPRPSAKSDSTPLRPHSVGSRRACTSDGRQSIRELIRETSSSVGAAYPSESRNGFGANGRLSARAVIRGLDCERRDRQSKWDPTSQTQHPCVLGSGATWARSARRRALSMCPRRCHCRRRCKNS